MAKTFIIADLHGRHDLLLMAIERIEQSSHSGGTVVFTGDYVDRGPASRQVIETLMAGPQTPRWKWVCLQGNHEEIMLAGCMGVLHWWLPNGGGATLISYGAENGGDAREALKLVPKEHLQWIRDLPLYYEDAHRVFVHAGVDETLDLADTPSKVLQWHLYGRDYPHGYRGKHVVHGHEQYEDGPVLNADRSDFDTLAWWTGRLVVGVFDDDVPGGPVSTIEIKGPSIQELQKETA
ncbi:metallophosphoesterase [Shinella zoogloeoides]|uniref:metallophosphoesterase n=1 Tax=Shinella zoogloeoides TaxID=352475 RepID=UPI001F5641C7|nr:metallophosphoesterase [Shinella zoogloeoides]